MASIQAARHWKQTQYSSRGELAGGGAEAKRASRHLLERDIAHVVHHLLNCWLCGQPPRDTSNNGSKDRRRDKKNRNTIWIEVIRIV